MTYEWHRTLAPQPRTREWYEEIDRRFLNAAYYARGAGGTPFGRFLGPTQVANKRVLEVGCGMGTHAALLARAGAVLTAVDLTRTAVAATRRRFDLFGLRGDIQQADGEHLPFDSSSFDFVWSWGVIHHSSSTEQCTAELARVLRPGGRVVLMVYHRRSLARYIHCGLIRGIVGGQLFHRSLDEIHEAMSDGAYARSFDQRGLRSMLEPFFEDLSFTVVGNKPELLPIPACDFKRSLEAMVPEWFAGAVLGRWGSMIVADGIRCAASSHDGGRSPHPGPTPSQGTR